MQLYLIFFLSFVYLFCQADSVIDSTEIKEITAQNHPHHPNPEYKLGQPTLSLKDAGTTSGNYGYGNFDNSNQLMANADNNHTLVEGLAANPLTVDLQDFQYSQMSLVQANVSETPTPNN